MISGQWPYVSIVFNAIGAKLFEISRPERKKRLAIVLDGNVYSAPVIQEKIGGGNAQITGTLPWMSKRLGHCIARRLASRSGQDAQKVTVGPSLGRDSIEAGKVAGMVVPAGRCLHDCLLPDFRGDRGFALVLNIVLLIGRWLR